MFQTDRYTLISSLDRCSYARALAHQTSKSGTETLMFAGRLLGLFRNTVPGVKPVVCVEYTRERLI